MRVIRFIFTLLAVATISVANEIEQLNFIEVSNDAEWQKVFDQAKAEDKVVFEGMTFEKISENEMNVYVDVKNEGKVETVKFNYKKR